MSKKDYVLITNKKPNCWGNIHHTLKPGDNKISLSVYEVFKEHDDFMKQVDSGHFVVYDDTTGIEDKEEVIRQAIENKEDGAGDPFESTTNGKNMSELRAILKARGHTKFKNGEGKVVSISKASLSDLQRLCEETAPKEDA